MKNEEFECWEFNVQIWFEDDEWNYSVVQEFESKNSTEVEPLLYGTAESRKEAAIAVGSFVSTLNF